MKVFVTIKSDINVRSYDDVDTWNCVDWGGRLFFYLSSKDYTKHTYIAIDDILRITIEEINHD